MTDASDTVIVFKERAGKPGGCCDALMSTDYKDPIKVCYPIRNKTLLPDRVFQNTGHGWWTESTVCETVRTPCGGDSMKANLIVEELDAGCNDP